MPRMASRCASNPAAKCCRTTFSAVATASSSNWNPTTMREALQARLAERGVSSAEFSDLMIRLLDRGVLCRDESKREAELYDRFLQVRELVEDYLAVLRIRLLHEPRFNLLRVFPPGAEVPGLPDTEDDSHALRQQEVALILVLRAEYDKSRS